MSERPDVAAANKGVAVADHLPADQGPPYAKDTVNPDPARYKKRTIPCFTEEARAILGIIESWWIPLEDSDSVTRNGDRRADAQRLGAAEKRALQPLSLPRDLHGYQPVRLWFSVGHPDNDMNDDWFEALFQTLRELVTAFSSDYFGATTLAAGRGGPSPWDEPSFMPQFLCYASEVARKDNHDGGWDKLLIDPRQRSYLVHGVLAKVLDEHVFSQLLFGGEPSQQEVLAQWDRIMVQEEGYQRKFKRCEEVQYFLGNNVLTTHFWDVVDRVTAQIATLLLPLLNLQRQRATKPTSSDDRTAFPGLPTFYQQLHDIVAVAGYASLCMAWSASIFQVTWPELGQLRELDHEHVGFEHVYDVSRAKAGQADADEAKAAKAASAAAAATHTTPVRGAKVKIVLWPVVRRYKPHWTSHRRAALRSASCTVLCKSRNAYYAGRVGDAHELQEREPDLVTHVLSERRRRQRAIAAQWARAMGLVFVLVMPCLAFAFPLLAAMDRSSRAAWLPAQLLETLGSAANMVANSPWARFISCEGYTAGFQSTLPARKMF